MAGMSEEQERLLDQASKAYGGDNTAERRQGIIDAQAPQWSPGNHDKFDLKKEASAAKSTIEKDTNLLTLMIRALSPQDEKANAYLLTLLYDLLREDSSAFDFFGAELKKNGRELLEPLRRLVQSSEQQDSYVADRAAWVLTAAIGHVPNFFDQSYAASVASLLLQPNGGRSELGKLEGLANLMKSDCFRSSVLEVSGVSDLIFCINDGNVTSPTIYRRVFAIWLLSFDSDVAPSLSNYDVVQKIKTVLTTSRVEKVVRLSLTVLTNFLAHKSLCESIVEGGVLDVVQQLEYEKWRDSELYAQINDVAAKISHEVNEMSNFDRYERELQTGKLSWGFIHSNKFWKENVNKFEANDFKAVKDLVKILMKDAIASEDFETLAVACHDVGEFVALHPHGKKKIAQLGAKERVMTLMASTDHHYREVRREALLCCQKIMLNKWQDLKTADASK